MYCIQNFGLSSLIDRVLVQSNRGFFEISDAGVSEIVRNLPKAQLIRKTCLFNLIHQHTDDNPSDVLDYLIDILGIVSKTDIEQSSVYFTSQSERFVNTARMMQFEAFQDLPFTEPSSIHVIAFDGTPDEEVVKRTMASLADTSRLLILFQARDCFIISSAWSPLSRLPCPLCTIDFALDRVFFDPKDTMMGLSDVYDLARCHGEKEPHIPIDCSDIAFVLRFVKQYTDAMTGMGFAGFAPFDPLLTSVVNMSTLNRQLIKVPLSPLCDCLYRKQSCNNDKVFIYA